MLATYYTDICSVSIHARPTSSIFIDSRDTGCSITPYLETKVRQYMNSDFYNMEKKALESQYERL